MDFTNGPCDTPAEGQWVCPLTSLTMSAAFSPQHDEVRKLMAQFTYKADLIKQVDTAYLLPGNFFKTQKMELDIVHHHIGPALRQVSRDFEQHAQGCCTCSQVKPF
jgi:hypothetical protein